MNYQRYKAITNIPGYALEDTDKITGSEDAYGFVPLVRRAVRYRCNALSSVPFRVYNGENEVDWPFPTGLKNLIWKAEASLLLKGAFYWLKIATRTRTLDLQWLNPTTMEVEYDNATRVYTFKQQVNAMRYGPWYNTPDGFQVVYMPEFDIAQDVGPGRSALETALTAAGLLHYQNRFASYFFQNGALNVTLLGVDPGTPTAEIQRVENFFQRLLSGVKRAGRVVGIPSDVKPTVLTQPLKDLAMPELKSSARQDVADAFEIPMPLLENPANRSVTEEMRLSFWQDTVRPRGEWLEEGINEMLMRPMGLRLEFGFDELDMFQEDESQRAGSLEALVRAGMDLDLAAEILGYDLSDEQWARLRENIERKREMGEQIQENIANAQSDTTDDTIDDELKRWERVAVRRLKGGKPIREFDSDIIPAALHGAIAGALETADTIETVKNVFAQAKMWRAYP